MEQRERYSRFFILFLSIGGFFLSLTMVKDHYNSEEACHYGQYISCQALTRSVYSEILNVPIAVFGCIWFLVLSFGSWKCISDDSGMRYIYLTIGVLTWVGVGLLFVVYLVLVELALRTICPYCTAVHIIVLIVFYLAWRVHKAAMTTTRNKRLPSVSNIIYNLRFWIIGIVLVNALPLFLFNVAWESPPPMDALSTCALSDVTIFVKGGCDFCERQKELLGEAWSLFNVVNCKNVKCPTDIEGYPTWVRGGVLAPTRHLGVMTMNQIYSFLECAS